MKFGQIQTRFAALMIRYLAILISMAASAAWASSTNELPQYDGVNQPDGSASGPYQRNELPKYDEIYQLLRAHLNGVSDAELNNAAVQGLLDHFQSSAMLVDNGAAVTSDSTAPLEKALVYDDSYAYIRVAKVETNLASEISASYADLVRTNKAKIKGVILDLRFAGGADFAAAAAVADGFISSEQPLLKVAGTVLHSTKKENAISVPLTVLINSQTSEAAEGLAAILHLTGTGLLLGSETAGHSGLFKDFPLAEGGELRIAAGQVELGDGSVFNGRVKPDIAVNTKLEDERIYWEHPYQVPASAGSTNAAGGSASVFRRYSEAELVREQRDGADLEADFAGTGGSLPETDIKILRDPALARALDLLKGLAVVQQGHQG